MSFFSFVTSVKKKWDLSSKHINHFTFVTNTVEKSQPGFCPKFHLPVTMN